MKRINDILSLPELDKNTISHDHFGKYCSESW